MLVFDSTPLIYLAKASKIELLKNIGEKKVIPKEVYREVVLRSRELGKDNANVVENAIKSRIFEVAKVNKDELYSELSRNPNLIIADVEVIVLAKSRGATAVLDDEYARDAAETAGVKTRSTIFLMLGLLKQGTITRDEARAAVNAMIKEGWRCSTELYAEVLEKIERCGR